MLESIGYVDPFEEPIEHAKKINEVIERVNILTEYVTLEMNQRLNEIDYNRVRELRKLLGIKIG